MELEKLTHNDGDHFSIPAMTINESIDNINGSNVKDDSEALQTLSQAHDALKYLTDRCEELERLSETIPVVRKEISGQIDQSIQMAQIALSERHTFLLNDLEHSLSLRNEAITKMHTEFESRLQRMSSHVDLLKRLLNVSTENVSKPVMKRATSATIPRDIALQKHKQEIDRLIQFPIPLHPSESDTMTFFPTELDQLLSMVKCVGAIGLTSIDASTTTMSKHADSEFSSIRRCDVEEENRIDIIPYDQLGQEVKSFTTKGFSVSISPRFEHNIYVSLSDAADSESSSSRLSIPTSTDNDQLTSKLQVLYQLPQPGSYELNVRLFGEHIKDSPTLLYARAKRKPELLAVINAMKEVSEMPRRMQAIVQSHRRCQSTPCAYKPDDKPEALADIYHMERGDLLHSVGTKGRGESEFANPTGICVTRNNRILVADSNNAMIQVFDSEGHFMSRFGEYGYQPGQLMRPFGIAETINGNYLVSDYELHCVTVFSTTGTYMSRFGQRYLAGPKGLLVDSRGRILVVDQKACMICIFKPTGKFINRFGTRGNTEGQFCNPSYVTVNSEGNIFVSDFALHQIKVFDMNGLYLYKFGVNGLDVGMMHGPTGLAFDRHDNLFIADWGNNRVQVYTQQGQYLYVIRSQVEPLNGPQDLAIQHSTSRVLVLDPGNYCFRVYQCNADLELLRSQAEAQAAAEAQSESTGGGDEGQVAGDSVESIGASNTSDLNAQID